MGKPHLIKNLNLIDNTWVRYFFKVETKMSLARLRLHIIVYTLLFKDMCHVIHFVLIPGSYKMFLTIMVRVTTTNIRKWQGVGFSGYYL